MADVAKSQDLLVNIQGLKIFFLLVRLQHRQVKDYAILGQFHFFRKNKRNFVLNELISVGQIGVFNVHLFDFLWGEGEPGEHDELSHFVSLELGSYA